MAPAKTTTFAGDTPLVSVIVLTLNGSDVIRECLDTLLKSDYPNFEVLVVNNGSVDATPKIVAEEYPSVRLITLPRNMGYAGGMNEGLKAAGGEIVVPLNDDTIIPSTMVRELIQPILRDPKVAIVGCKILFPDRKTIQHAGAWILPNGLTQHYGYKEEDHGQWDTERDVDYVTGCSIAIPIRIFEEFGLYDDRYFPTYFEEVDLAAKVTKAGYRIVYAPRAFLYHLESKTEVRYSPKFLYRLNKSRWRFVLKNFSFREILRAARYEVGWLAKSIPREEWGLFARALARAYAATLLKLPFILHDRWFRHLPLRRTTCTSGAEANVPLR